LGWELANTRKKVTARVMTVTRNADCHGSENTSPFRPKRKTVMNRLSFFAIGGSLAALLAVGPALAKSPAPLSADARVVDYDDAERLQLQALWTAKQSCPIDAARDVISQRVWDGCVSPVAIRESGDALAMNPKIDK
jgi:hypothetical protein